MPSLPSPFAFLAAVVKLPSQVNATDYGRLTSFVVHAGLRILWLK